MLQAEVAGREADKEGEGVARGWAVAEGVVVGWTVGVSMAVTAEGGEVMEGLLEAVVLAVDHRAVLGVSREELVEGVACTQE